MRALVWLGTGLLLASGAQAADGVAADVAAADAVAADVVAANVVAADAVAAETVAMGDVAVAADAVAAVESAAVGNVAAGREKAYTCTGCHGIPGYKNSFPSFHVPKIAGQEQVYLSNSLKAYRAGERQHPTMRAQAEAMTDQDIADLSAYLSQVKPENQ